VNVAGSVAAGSYSLKVKAVSGSINKEANLSLTVNSLLGSTWIQLGSELNISSSQDAESPSLALDTSGNPVVAWFENDSTSDNIYVKRWDGTNWLPQGSGLDTVLSQAAQYPKVAMDSLGYPVVVWQEQVGSAKRIYVKRRLP